MTDGEFWTLIETVDQAALEAGDEDAAVAPLVEALARLSPERIEGFEEQLAHKLHALDGRAFADAAGAVGRSADGFLYARCYVVARGQSRYAAVLENANEMPSSVDDSCEPILCAAEEAYERSTGEEWEFDASVSYETGSNEALWRES